MNVHDTGHANERIRQIGGGYRARPPRDDAEREYRDGEQREGRAPARGPATCHGAEGVRAGVLVAGSDAARVCSRTRSCGGLPRAPRGTKSRTTKPGARWRRT